jgi:hypothetical protein
MTGTINASMTSVAFCRIWYSPAATGPRGSRTPEMNVGVMAGLLRG